MPTWFSSNRARLLDALWLLALALYITAGVPLVSFHGDEAMQIYMSDDYAVAFFDRDLPRLTAGPPARPTTLMPRRSFASSTAR